MAGQDEVEKLRKEVEMWKGEWGRSDKEKKRLEAIIEQQESDRSSKVR